MMGPVGGRFEGPRFGLGLGPGDAPLQGAGAGIAQVQAFPGHELAAGHHDFCQVLACFHGGFANT